MSGADADEVLMMRYRNGEMDAFDTLYGRYKGPLYRYFLRQCAGQSVAEELFQDVWMKLIGARERYQVTAKFTTYLFHLAHNRLVDHYRRQSTGLPVSYQDCVDPDDLKAASTWDPQRQAAGHQQLNQLLVEIKALPEAQREALLMREEGGLSVEEIAQITGVTKETAKSRLRYAVSKLRQAMLVPA